jgi:thiol-disulfide isomerase/thioredoxin
MKESVIKPVVLILFLWTNTFVYGLSDGGYRIGYTLHGVQDTMAWLCEVRGSEVVAIDSAEVIQGRVFFAGEATLPHGVYKIVFNDTLFTDIIVTEPEILLESSLPAIIANMRVHTSTENVLLFGYWQYFFKLQDTLDEVVARGRELYYASGGKPSRALDALQARADALEHARIIYIQQMKEDYPDHFAPKLVWSFQQPDYRYYLMHGGKPYPSEQEYYKMHFFDRLDFGDSRMVHTEVLFVMINDYLRTFAQPPGNDVYIELIDHVLTHAKANDVVYQYCIELFLQAFDQSPWVPVYLHLIEGHYLSAPLSNKSLRQAYRRKAEAIRNTSIGSKIPQVCGTTPSGTPHCLLDELGTTTVFMIWSLGCEHCESMLPGLGNISREYTEKGLRVFSFTLAEGRDSLAHAMEDFDITWVNVSDYQGFVSEVVEAFNISVTPVIFLLDSAGRITDKPKSIAELYANLVVRYRDQ